MPHKAFQSYTYQWDFKTISSFKDGYMNAIRKSENTMKLRQTRLNEYSRQFSKNSKTPMKHKCNIPVKHFKKYLINILCRDQ